MRFTACHQCFTHSLTMGWTFMSFCCIWRWYFHAKGRTCAVYHSESFIFSVFRSDATTSVGQFFKHTDPDEERTSCSVTYILQIFSSQFLSRKEHRVAYILHMKEHYVVRHTSYFHSCKNSGHFAGIRPIQCLQGRISPHERFRPFPKTINADHWYLNLVHINQLIRQIKRRINEASTN